METIVGLAILMVLGYLASYHFRTFFRKWKGLDQFLTSGFLFIFIGVLCGPMFLNVLSGAVVRQLDPFIYLGLGWIGFIVGLQFEWRLLRHVPRRLFVLAQLESFISAAVLLVGVLIFLSGLALVLRLPAFDVWTGAIVLTAGGTISSSLAIHYYAKTLPKAGKALRPLEYIVSLHVFIPLLGLILLYSFFHIGQTERVHLPGWTWLLVHLITGLLIGLTLFYLLKGRMKESERLLLILGGIAFSAGIAGYLHISPIVVCFVAGIVFANMPGFNGILMEAVLRQAERPVYFIMLILAGSLWDFRSLWVWGFLMIYVMIRFVAKGTAFLAISKAEPDLHLETPLLGGVLAQGPLAIALVIGYQQLYASVFLPYIVTAVLGGAVANEFLAGQLLVRAFPVSSSDQKVGKGTKKIRRVGTNL